MFFKSKGIIQYKIDIDTLFLIKYNAFSGDDRHPCDRVCQSNEKSMVCRYEFNVELYNKMSKVRISRQKSRQKTQN